MTNQIQELKEKRAILDKDYWQALEEVSWRKSKMDTLSQCYLRLKLERDSLHDLSRLHDKANQRLTTQLDAAQDALAQEERVQKGLTVATEAARIILAVGQGDPHHEEDYRCYTRESRKPSAGCLCQCRTLAPISCKWQRDCSGNW